MLKILIKSFIVTIVFIPTICISFAHDSSSVQQITEVYKQNWYHTVTSPLGDIMCYYWPSEHGDLCKYGSIIWSNHGHMHIFSIDSNKKLTLDLLKSLTLYSQNKFELSWDQVISGQLEEGMFYSISKRSNSAIEVNIVYKNLYFNSGYWDRETISKLTLIFIEWVRTVEFHNSHSEVPEFNNWYTISIDNSLMWYNLEKDLHVQFMKKIKYGTDDSLTKEEFDELQELFIEIGAMGEEIAIQNGRKTIYVQWVKIDVDERWDGTKVYSFELEEYDILLRSKTYLTKQNLGEVLIDFNK